MVYFFNGGSNIQIKNSLFELQPSFQRPTSVRMFTAEAFTMRARWATDYHSASATDGKMP